MEISQREKDAITILDIQGEIDLYNAPEIKDIIQIYKPVCLSANDSDSTKTLGQKIAESLQTKEENTHTYTGTAIRSLR